MSLVKKVLNSYLRFIEITAVVFFHTGLSPNLFTSCASSCLCFYNVNYLASIFRPQRFNPLSSFSRIASIKLLQYSSFCVVAFIECRVNTTALTNDEDFPIYAIKGIIQSLSGRPCIETVSYWVY